MNVPVRYLDRPPAWWETVLSYLSAAGVGLVLFGAWTLAFIAVFQVAVLASGKVDLLGWPWH